MQGGRVTLSEEPQAAADLPAQVLCDFINTYNVEVRAESLRTPDDLGEWLARHRLLPSGIVVDEHTLTLATTLREAIRLYLFTRSDGGSPPTPLNGQSTPPQGLDDVLADLPVRLTIDRGQARLIAADDRVATVALAPMVDLLGRWSRDQSWSRLKVCSRAQCRWAFYDLSRNQSRRWCTMATCGNQTKMRRARAHRKQTLLHQPQRDEQQLG